jgi:ABC-2 type transport system permease protein
VSSANILRSAFRIGRRDAAEMWSSLPVWMVAWLVRVATAASMWILMGRLLGSDEILLYLLIGQGIMVGPQSVGFTVAASAWDRMEGTYPQLVTTPSSLVPYLIGRSSIWLVNGIASSILTLGVLLPLFRVPVDVRTIPGILLGILVINCAAFGFFLFLGCFVVRRPSIRNLVHNLASVLIVSIAGVAVPTTFWPDWVQLFAAMLPVSHGLAAVRHLFAIGTYEPAMMMLCSELAIGAIWLFFAALLIDRMADLGRRDGSIEVSLG